MNDAIKTNAKTDVGLMQHDDFSFLHRPLKIVDYGHHSLIESGQMSVMVNILARAVREVLFRNKDIHRSELHYYSNQLLACKHAWAVVHMLFFSRIVKLLELTSVKLRTCERRNRDAIGITKLLYITSKYVRGPPENDSAIKKQSQPTYKDLPFIYD